MPGGEVGGQRHAEHLHAHVAGGDCLQHGRHADEVGRRCVPAMRISAGVSKCGPWKPTYTPSGRSGSTVRATARSRALYRSVRSTKRDAERRRRVGAGERRPAGEVDVVADQDRLADRPVPAQRAGAVRQDDGAAAGGGGGADAVGDDGRVVALVEVDAARGTRAPGGRRSRRSGPRRRGRRPTAAGSRAGRRGRRSGPSPSSARRAPTPSRGRRRRRGARRRCATPASPRPGVARPKRLSGWRPRCGILRSASMRTIEWRGDHAVLIDQTRLPHEVGVAGGARRRHDDRRHPPPGRARRAGDRCGRRRSPSRSPPVGPSATVSDDVVAPRPRGSPPPGRPR